VRRTTHVGYKAEFQPLKDKQTDPSPRHEPQELADDANLESYLAPFMPYASGQSSVKRSGHKDQERAVGHLVYLLQSNVETEVSTASFWRGWGRRQCRPARNAQTAVRYAVR
jgi:hypothetical protein